MLIVQVEDLGAARARPSARREPVVPEPEATATRRAEVLDATLDGPATLALCGGQQRLTFERGDADLAETHVEGPDGRPHSLPKGTPWTSRP